jgi:hypothetical protein
MYALYIEKEQNSGPKLTMPCENLPDKTFWLELWSSICAKKTLQGCTKTNLQRNQIHGVLMVGFRIWCFLCPLNTEQNAGPKK